MERHRPWAIFEPVFYKFWGMRDAQGIAILQKLKNFLHFSTSQFSVFAVWTSSHLSVYHIGDGVSGGEGVKDGKLRIAFDLAESGRWE